MPAPRSWPRRVSTLPLSVLLAVLGAACQATTPAPTPPPPVPASPAAAAGPSARPLPSPSPSAAPAPAAPSPSPLPTPSPQALPPAPTAEPFALDAQPFAVVIDNIAEARPQSGLGAADVVYEAPAEGGIPRLMALYLRPGGAADRIGPVRSARDYFVYLADEYRTPLVHIGASPQGFAALSATGLPHVQEVVGGHVFTRDPGRLAPHNAFVSTGSVRAELARLAIAPQVSTAGLEFGSSFTAGSEPALRVRIAYPGSAHYTVGYDYDADSRTYPRVMDGAADKDGVTGEQYAARSIIIQYVAVQPIPGDTAGRVDVALVGSGRGTLVAEGGQVPLDWSKADDQAPTRFRRADGVPFLLPEGQVWIQIVPLETGVEITGAGPP
jgi:Protein of unknown function (DUF3048) N-terminal domain/Protein of unknown function (DUF3048) C-terminal domain